MHDEDRNTVEAVTERLGSLECEIESLKKDKQELHERLLRLNQEHAEKYDSLTGSVTFRLGEAIVAAATSPGPAVSLPFRLWRIYRDWRSRQSKARRPAMIPLEDRDPVVYRSAIAPVSGTVLLPPARGRPSRDTRILFMPTNGAGLGHVTRVLGLARRLKTDARISEMVFLTTSEALTVIRQEGFVAYHHPGPAQLTGRIPPKGWQTSFLSLFGRIVDNHSVNVFVYDGVSASSVAAALSRYASMNKVWIRRMLVKEGKAELFNQHAYLFDLQLCPGELEQATVAQDSEGRVTIPPTVFLDRAELLPRRDAIEELGLDPAKKAVLVQLGAGNINEIDTQSEMILEAPREFSQLQVVLAQSPISYGRLRGAQGVKTIRDYPVSRYYQAFDMAISAAGYNTVTELAYFGVPSIFIPNLATGSDDQLGRALIAQRTGLGLVLNPLTISGLRDSLQILMDDAVNAEYRERCRIQCQVNGSDVAAQILADFLFQG